MSFKVATAFRFPPEWSEIECCRFTDAGVWRADWFDDNIGIEGRMFAKLDDANLAAQMLRETYKGPDANGVEVDVTVEVA
jgi:hypothetical protein